MRIGSYNGDRLGELQNIDEMRPVVLGFCRAIYRYTKIGVLMNTGLSLSNDLYLNIKTMPHPLSVKEREMEEMLRNEHKAPEALHKDGVGYHSPNYWNLYKIVKILNPGPDDVLYDLGSGMGRILCVFARRTLKRCVGIELFESLCLAARKNAMSLRGRKSPIEIVCEDASKAELSDGTIYFFYNPFGVKTLSNVLEKIQGSLAVNPREISIVYYNSEHEDILESCKWLRLAHVFRNMTNQRITFWNNAVTESSGADS